MHDPFGGFFRQSQQQQQQQQQRRQPDFGSFSFPDANRREGLAGFVNVSRGTGAQPRPSPTNSSSSSTSIRFTSDGKKITTRRQTVFDVDVGQDVIHVTEVVEDDV